MIVKQIDIDEIQCTAIIVVIEPDNLERMKQADPITIENLASGGFLLPIKYPNGLRFLIAYEEDPGPLYEMIARGDAQAVLKHIMRGYKYKAVDGKVYPVERSGES